MNGRATPTSAPAWSKAIRQILAAAPVRLHRRLRLNRQATVSMEGRGALAYWDHRLDELVVYLSTQGGQVKRMALSRMLGLPENKVRVIAPDVGGGFGGKNRIMPEDVAVAALALKARSPGALDRGPARASAGLAARARPHLRSHDLRRTRRHAARPRRRYLYRCRRLCAVADRVRFRKPAWRRAT